MKIELIATQDIFCGRNKDQWITKGKKYEVLKAFNGGDGTHSDLPNLITLTGKQVDHFTIIADNGARINASAGWLDMNYLYSLNKPMSKLQELKNKKYFTDEKKEEIVAASEKAEDIKNQLTSKIRIFQEEIQLLEEKRDIISDAFDAVDSGFEVGDKELIEKGLREIEEFEATSLSNIERIKELLEDCKLPASEDEAVIKFKNLVYKLFSLYGATSDLLSIVGSFRDTQSDEDTLDALEQMIESLDKQSRGSHGIIYKIRLILSFAKKGEQLNALLSICNGAILTPRAIVEELDYLLSKIKTDA